MFVLEDGFHWYGVMKFLSKHLQVYVGMDLARNLIICQEKNIAKGQQNGSAPQPACSHLGTVWACWKNVRLILHPSLFRTEKVKRKIRFFHGSASNSVSSFLWQKQPYQTQPPIPGLENTWVLPSVVCTDVFHISTHGFTFKWNHKSMWNGCYRIIVQVVIYISMHHTYGCIKMY